MAYVFHYLTCTLCSEHSIRQERAQCAGHAGGRVKGGSGKEDITGRKREARRQGQGMRGKKVQI